MILERATHRPVAEYLQEKIWKPLGMEYPASWSLDSSASGFEKMESGLNARAIDLAKFGRLFLARGNWNGKQIISPHWVTESTAPDPTDKRPWKTFPQNQEQGGYYKYFWWGQAKAGGAYDFMALGKLGQVIAVSPQKRMVAVRYGNQQGDVDSWLDVMERIFQQTP